MASYVKTFINEIFNLRATLSIPYINLDNYYIRLGECFDYSRSRYENNIVKDIYKLDDFFNYIPRSWGITWIESVLSS